MEVCGRRSLKDSVEINQDICRCSTCQSEGSNIQAKAYCKTCDMHFCTSSLNFHQSKEQNRTHIIKYREHHGNEKGGGYSNFCDTHETEKVILYCQRHDFVGCDKCMKLSHEYCYIQSTADVSWNYGNSKEFDMIKEDMNNMIAEVVSSKQRIVSSLSTAEKIKEIQTEKVRTFHADLKEYLIAAEEKILQDVQQMYTNDVEFLQKLYDSYGIVESEINKYREQLHQHSLDSDHLFTTVKMAKKRLSDLQGSTSFNVETKLNTYEFQPSSDLIKLKENLAPLGILQVYEQKSSEEYSENSVDCNLNAILNFADSINVRNDGEEDCWITGMTMISGDEILLADNANSSLKILNIKERKVTFICKTAKKPFDVTTIKSRTTFDADIAAAAATLPSKGEILLVNTKNDLTQDSTIKVRKNCRGIDYRNGLLAVAFSSPPTVQVLNLNGKIIYTIKDTQSFRHPGSVVITNDITDMFVSDFVTNKVYQLTVSSPLVVKTKFEDLNRPSGLAVTNSNKVFVCCTADKEHISLINSEENQIQSLYAEHIQIPVAIVINEENNYMYVSENKGAIGCDCIKVYHLKQ